MCGIAGTFGLNRTIQPPDVDFVSGMLDRQRHRGPDADGLLADQRVVLGHIRLAIIDLSVLGRQPMSDDEELVSVVFNGEIYNYKELTQDLRAAGRKFCSNSDTEVLIHGYKHWGLE